MDPAQTVVVVKTTYGFHFNPQTGAFELTAESTAVTLEPRTDAPPVPAAGRRRPAPPG